MEVQIKNWIKYKQKKYLQDKFQQIQLDHQIKKCLVVNSNISTILKTDHNLEIKM
jgi:hypothetical protein